MTIPHNIAHVDKVEPYQLCIRVGSSVIPLGATSRVSAKELNDLMAEAHTLVGGGAQNVRINFRDLYVHYETQESDGLKKRCINLNSRATAAPDQAMLRDKVLKVADKLFPRPKSDGDRAHTDEAPLKAVSSAWGKLQIPVSCAGTAFASYKRQDHGYRSLIQTLGIETVEKQIRDIMGTKDVETIEKRLRALIQTVGTEEDIETVEKQLHALIQTVGSEDSETFEKRLHAFIQTLSIEKVEAVKNRLRDTHELIVSTDQLIVSLRDKVDEMIRKKRKEILKLEKTRKGSKGDDLKVWLQQIKEFREDAVALCNLRAEIEAVDVNPLFLAVAVLGNLKETDSDYAKTLNERADIVSEHMKRMLYLQLSPGVDTRGLVRTGLDKIAAMTGLAEGNEGELLVGLRPHVDRYAREVGDLLVFDQEAYFARIETDERSGKKSSVEQLIVLEMKKRNSDDTYQPSDIRALLGCQFSDKTNEALKGFLQRQWSGADDAAVADADSGDEESVELT